MLVGGWGGGCFSLGAEKKENIFFVGRRGVLFGGGGGGGGGGTKVFSPGSELVVGAAYKR